MRKVPPIEYEKKVWYIFITLSHLKLVKNPYDVFRENNMSTFAYTYGYGEKY